MGSTTSDRLKFLSAWVALAATMGPVSVVIVAQCFQLAELDSYICYMHVTTLIAELYEAGCLVVI